MLLAAVAAPRRARAQDRVAFAQQRFERGVGLFDAHDPARALLEFRAALVLYESPNSRLYLARCLLALDQLPEAVSEFERAAREADERAQTDPRYITTRDAAQTELAALAPRLGRLTVTVPDVPDSARVTVGGREVPVPALGLAVAVTPGRVPVTVDARGYETARATPEVAAGQSLAIELRLRRAPAPPPHATPPTRSRAGSAPGSPPPVPARASALRTAAWISLGAGGVALAVSGITALVANAQFTDLATGEHMCLPRCGSMEQLDQIAAGQRLEVAAQIGLGVGLAGVLAGAVLFTVEPSRTTGAAAVRASVGPGGFTVRGVF